MANVVRAFVGAELVEELSDPAPEIFSYSLRRLAKQSFELGEGVLDWVEIGE